MSDRAQFEKWLKKTHIWIRGSTLAEDGAWHGFIARQPEIDAKDEVIDGLALQNGILKAEIGRLADEHAALKAEVITLERISVLFHEKCDEAANYKFGYDRLKAEESEHRADAERWCFHRDNNNFRYFRNSGVWEILGEDRSTLIEGRASTYQDAVDAAMKETK